ncbi:MAG: hypothetical protein JWN04_1632, partial [Myxococcaceae bacterium]|nr:hypothetical protein [Myxococcaceae bacterium]
MAEQVPESSPIVDGGDEEREG